MASLAEISPIENENYLENASYEVLMQKALLYDKAKEFERAIDLKKKAFQKASDNPQIIRSSWEVASSYELMARHYKHIDPHTRLKYLDEATEWLDLSEQVEGKIKKVSPKFAMIQGNLAIKASGVHVLDPSSASIASEVVSYEIDGTETELSAIEELDTEKYETEVEASPDIEPQFTVGNEVWYTEVPFGYKPTDPDDLSYEKTVIMGVSIDERGVVYQLGGIELTKFKTKEISERELFEMWESTQFIQEFQRDCRRQAIKDKSVWSRFKKLFIKNNYY